MSNDIFSTIIPSTKDDTSFLNISPTKILQYNSLNNNSLISPLNHEDKSSNVTLLNGLHNIITTTITPTTTNTMVDEFNKSKIVENITNILESTTTTISSPTTALQNLTNTNILSTISPSTISKKINEFFDNNNNNNTLINNKSQEILYLHPQTTTVKDNLINNITDIINKTIDNVKKDYEILENDNTSTSFLTTTVKTTNLRNNYNLLEKYPFLVFVILIAIIIIFILFLGVVISFLYTNRRKIIRGERNNKVLNEYGNPDNRQNVFKYIFKCCCRKKEDYGNLERQVSASNLAPYRRPPLPPINRRPNNDNEDGFEGSYIGDGKQRLRPVQMLDPAVYGTLENDNSTRSTINQSYKSTTLTTNTSTIDTNQKRKNFYKEREL